MNSKRKLSNIRLTRKFHLRHMGLWVLIAIPLVILMNVLLYVLLAQTWGAALGGGFEHTGEASNFEVGLRAGLAIEAVLFCFAVLMLARATSHRIAGPYIGLQRICERIAHGERDARIHFRDYDGLEELERAFNGMLDTLSGPPRR